MTLLDHIKKENAETQEWIDAGDDRWSAMVIDDIPYWNSLGVYTVDDYEKHTLVNDFSDLHKDARGFRPRRHYTYEEMESMMDVLIAELPSEEDIQEQRDWLKVEEKYWNQVDADEGKMYEMTSDPIPNHFEKIAMSLGY